MPRYCRTSAKAESAMMTRKRDVTTADVAAAPTASAPRRTRNPRWHPTVAISTANTSALTRLARIAGAVSASCVSAPQDPVQVGEQREGSG